MRANTRGEYRRLLVNFALTYFDREVRVRELDRAAVQHFVDWLTTRSGRDGRLCDRSIANTLTPLRLASDAAVADCLLHANPAEHAVLPRRRAGRAWSMRERRFLTWAELVRLLDEVPAKWRPLSELLAATGLRVSEAVALRWSDLVLDGDTHRVRTEPAASAALDGPHSPAFTLQTYGHLIDGDLGPALDLRKELASAKRRSTAQREGQMIRFPSRPIGVAARHLAAFGQQRERQRPKADDRMSSAAGVLARRRKRSHPRDCDSAASHSPHDPPAERRRCI